MSLSHRLMQLRLLMLARKADHPTHQGLQEPLQGSVPGGTQQKKMIKNGVKGIIAS
jgi:hypothetical protein